MDQYIKARSNGFKSNGGSKTLYYRVEKIEEHPILGTCYYGRRVKANDRRMGFGNQKLICTNGEFKFNRYQLITE